MNIGLSESSRNGVIEVLKGVLGNQHVLYIKKRNFHWNLIGERFHTLHVFYEQQYEALATAIDSTAERIRMVGGVSPGSMKEFLGLASLKEVEGSLAEGEVTIEALVKDHEQVIRELREVIGKVEEEYGDVGTADFLTGLIQSHEEMAWMLRSFLREK